MNEVKNVKGGVESMKPSTFSKEPEVRVVSNDPAAFTQGQEMFKPSVSPVDVGKQG